MVKNIAALQYITQEFGGYTHVQLAEKMCVAGIKWIQLRVKNKSQDEYLSIAQKVKRICDNYACILIINDNVEITKKIKADGVHLGKSDVRPSVARKELGNNIIIGGTANTYEDIIDLISEGVDYIGLGPYKFTTTKKELSPVLGIEGYKNILEKCKKSNITIPIVGIGGITVKDVDQLLSSGLYGIAVSSAISKAENINDAILQFNNKLKYELEKS